GAVGTPFMPASARIVSSSSRYAVAQSSQVARCSSRRSRSGAASVPSWRSENIASYSSCGVLSGSLMFRSDRSRGWSQVPLDLLAQGEPRAVQARLHRAVGESGDLADLLHRQILEIAEDHEHAVILLERRDRLLHQLVELGALDLAIGPARHARRGHR